MLLRKRKKDFKAKEKITSKILGKKSTIILILFWASF
jgi:hypothetical protein